MCALLILWVARLVILIPLRLLTRMRYQSRRDPVFRSPARTEPPVNQTHPDASGEQTGDSTGRMSGTTYKASNREIVGVVRRQLKNFPPWKSRKQSQENEDSDESPHKMIAQMGIGSAVLVGGRAAEEPLHKKAQTESEKKPQQTGDSLAGLGTNEECSAKDALLGKHSLHDHARGKRANIRSARRYEEKLRAP